MLNNKFKFSFLGLLAILVLFVSSCKKEEINTQEEAKITITSPAEHEEYHHNSTVNIVGKIEYAEGLHGYKLIVRTKSDNAIQFKKEEHAHGTVLEFNEAWVDNLSTHSEVELEVTATIDHDGGTTTKKITFHCHP